MRNEPVTMNDFADSVREELQNDLDAIRNANIPRDIVYKQGASVLGL